MTPPSDAFTRTLAFGDMTVTVTALWLPGVNYSFFFFLLWSLSII